MVVSKIAVIGDVHSNILALRSSLRSIEDYELNSRPVDNIVFVGDLLSYGVRPEETLYELHELLSSRPSVFILGNHDQLYLDLLSNSVNGYYGKLPDWIKESVDFNLSKIDGNKLLDINFVPYYSFNDVFISHANFSVLSSGISDWRYINSDEDHYKQLLILSSFGSRLGVLGHTHRTRCFSLEASEIGDEYGRCIASEVQLNTAIDHSRYSCSLVNAGSIGQPREKVWSDPAWLLIEFEDFLVKKTTFVSFKYDVSAHLADISMSQLSSSCISKLRSYFS